MADPNSNLSRRCLGCGRGFDPSQTAQGSLYCGLCPQSPKPNVMDDSDSGPGPFKPRERLAIRPRAIQLDANVFVNPDLVCAIVRNTKDVGRVIIAVPGLTFDMKGTVAEWVEKIWGP